MKIIELFIYAILLLSFYACESSHHDQIDDHTTPQNTTALGNAIPVSNLITQIPELAFYKHRLEEALLKDPPVLQINPKDLEDNDAIMAQQLALSDSSFVRDVYHKISGQAIRSEIMNVRSIMPSDVSELKIECKDGNCFRVELYNYYYNNTTIAIIDVKHQKVLKVSHHVSSQATINPHLKKIAIAIALNSPEVTIALGLNPSKKDALMSNVTTSLNGSKCERSRHLCVAPTFVIGDKALWTIVDLTDWQLVGLRWTDVGEPNKNSIITERSLQDEFIMKNYCDKENDLIKGDWSLTHRLTSSDGLEIINVRFKNKHVLNSAKIVDWHVSYSFKEGFGYNDAMGCPMFSTAAVVAFNAPFTEEIIEGGKNIGFALIQDFRSAIWPQPCNYRYQNRYEFYKDGSFRVVGVQLGRGCGVTGIYRPVFRIHVASPKHQFANFKQWKNGNWEIWENEDWYLQTQQTNYDRDGHLFKLTNPDGSGYFVTPNIGQYNDGSKGDYAYTYITKNNKDEGENNMVSFGSCCANDYQQGPEKFIQSHEKIENEDLVIWYVPQMPNSNLKGKKYCWAETRVKDGKAYVKTWPGIVGPKFTPFNKKD